MRTKRLVRHAAARRDLEQASDYYEDTAGQEVAKRFLTAARAAFREISARPGAGSPRHGDELRLPHLRARRISRFPYLIFYVENADFIEVTRVLHEKRDLRHSYRGSDS